ncbi:hypothetical protein ASC95_18075 [Pelomonas sp. Root1217]|uniref:DUF3313 domain-containing protein n=1 Tax=Pelomonas sp. Root1217 TaxID=1736430 RepID=UPI00070C9112|nr:DUF3313 domain-containing protein [Pelomonas sp. Root1217]KQV49502.1 hypothetical protein ASC95_18075 [Pelomonas sp. Root1217]
MNALQRFLSVACLACISACSTVMVTAHGNFLSDYSGLTPDPDGGSTRSRSAIAIDPSQVSIGAVEWHMASSGDVSDEERGLLLRHLNEELATQLRELPSSPLGRPAILRAAITRVETVSPALNAVSALVFIVPLDRGGASVEMEAIDATTGEQLAALTLGHFAPLSEFKSRFSKLAPAQLALSKAANDFGTLLRTPTRP